MLKRVLDIIISLLGLTIFSPLFVLLSLAIRLESKGPIFYRGIRVGQYGKPFRIYKFRSMVADAEQIGAASTSKSDSRITRVGRFIRKLKLDEACQLINVISGEMSIVGPRPEVQKFVDLYTEEEKEILKLRPGITDWASIKFHNEGEIIEESMIEDADEAYAILIRPEKLKLQLKYLRENNLWVDLRIIVATFLTGISTGIGGGPVGVSEGSVPTVIGGAEGVNNF